MARRNGRPGDHLMTSDYSGSTEYASKLVKDYWGNYGLQNEVLQRNLQEISSPLGDPYPVKEYNGPQYEVTVSGQFNTTPKYLGKTTTLFPLNSPAAQNLGLTRKSS